MAMGGHAAGKRALGARVKPYLFLLPMLVFAAAFSYYPFLKTLLYGVSRVNLRGQITDFTGLDNFLYLFSRRDFGIALKNTLFLTALTVPLTLALTLLFAALAARRRRTSALIDALFMLPMAISMSAAALTFKVLFNPTVGYINYLFGLEIGWLTDGKTAIYALLLLMVWMGLGVNFMLLLSALRGIPEEMTDAATVDGAGAARRFFAVQLPLVSPTILYVVCTDMVLAMTTAGPVIILTQGGPSRATTTLLYMMYASGYGSSNYSLAACVSLIAFLLTLLCTGALFSLEKKKVFYQ